MHLLRGSLFSRGCCLMRESANEERRSWCEAWYVAYFREFLVLFDAFTVFDHFKWCRIRVDCGCEEYTRGENIHYSSDERGSGIVGSWRLRENLRDSTRVDVTRPGNLDKKIEEKNKKESNCCKCVNWDYRGIHHSLFLLFELLYECLACDCEIFFTPSSFIVNRLGWDWFHWKEAEKNCISTLNADFSFIIEFGIILLVVRHFLLLIELTICFL